MTCHLLSTVTAGDAIFHRPFFYCIFHVAIFHFFMRVHYDDA